MGASAFEQKPERLADLTAALKSGRLALSDYISRLEERFKEKEPSVRAFVEGQEAPFERMRGEARALEHGYPNPQVRPLLYGVPVGIKDIFNVDGLPTRGGSRLPPEVFRGQEAKCVRDLRAEGALIAGKTVSTEFAYFAPGPTRNPHDLDRTPGGSSSGSAAAVAAGFCPLALGTQTIGSIIRPAAYCGVVGFKPTFGRIPLDGVLPLAPSADHVGIFASDAAGAALAASVLCREWDDEAEALPFVFGIPEGPYLEKTAPEAMEAFAGFMDRLAGKGVKLRPVRALDGFEGIAQRHKELVAAEAAMVHAPLYETYRELYHPKTAELIEAGMKVGSARLKECRESGRRLRRHLSKLSRDEGVFAFISPSAVGPAPIGLESTGDPVMNLPWTHAGLPVVGLPVRLPGEMPLGIQLAGPWMRDESLLKTALAVEALLKL